MSKETTKTQNKEIHIKVTEYQRKSDGIKFNGYRAVDKKGKLMETSFTKQCLKDFGAELPNEDFLLIVNPDDMNIDRHSNIRPKLWIQKIVSIEELKIERSEKVKKDIEETF